MSNDGLCSVGVAGYNCSVAHPSRPDATPRWLRWLCPSFPFGRMSDETEKLSDLPMTDELPAAPADASFGFRQALAKVREFPQTPGVYLMKDSAGRVIYVGKAKNLRAGPAAISSKPRPKTAAPPTWVREIADIDFIAAESEVDALLIEARLIKDVQPKFNQELKDDKTFPYLEITTREDFPRVEFTRKPHDTRRRSCTARSPAPGVCAARCRYCSGSSSSAPVRSTSTSSDERWRWFRPCLLARINQCTAPCNLRISKEEYRRDIDRLRSFLDGKKRKLLDEMKGEMLAGRQGAEVREGGPAARRDSACSKRSTSAANSTRTSSPRSFTSIRRKGWPGLKKVLKLAEMPRTIEGVDIAHLGGGETVASLVQFIDGLPFKPGYRRYQDPRRHGIDDFASIREVVARRFQRLHDETSRVPRSSC